MYYLSEDSSGSGKCLWDIFWWKLSSTSTVHYSDKTLEAKSLESFVISTVFGVNKWKWPGIPRISKIISWGLHLSRCIVPRKTDLIEPPISSQSKCFTSLANSLLVGPDQNPSDIRTLSPVSILNLQWRRYLISWELWTGHLYLYWHLALSLNTKHQ